MQESVPLGIVLERRRSKHPWGDFTWRPVAVIPGAPARDPKGEWTTLHEGDGWARYHAGTLPLRLFRDETAAYKTNLSQKPPRVFIVLRNGDAEAGGHEVFPFVATASPVEAQEYLDSSEEIVEPVPMPIELIACLQAFVDRHHMDVPFEKRKRKRHDPESGAPGRPPGAARRTP